MQDYGEPTPDELGPLAEILTRAFGFPIEHAASWFESAGLGSVRVLREGGVVAGGLLALPMGQVWGGRVVPMTGVGAVGVGIEHRGGGVATRLMTAALREMRAARVPISALYPATWPLYRRVGYELAGSKHEITLPLATLRARDRSLPVRRATEADAPAMLALYRAYALTRPGHLERSAYLQGRTETVRGIPAPAWVVGEPGAIEGYVRIAQGPHKEQRTFDLLLSDVVASTPRAGARILALLADHASRADAARWFGPAEHPLLGALEERHYSVALADHWMLRIVDVQRALEARGWPPGMRGTVSFDVDDPLLPENSGPITLDVDGGEARVRPGAERPIRIDVRGLASLYSGFQTPDGLRVAGLLDGPADALALAAALFAGPAPSLGDHF